MFCDGQRRKVHNHYIHRQGSLQQHFLQGESLYNNILVRTDVVTDSGCIGYKTKTSYDVRLCEGARVIS